MLLKLKYDWEKTDFSSLKFTVVCHTPTIIFKKIIYFQISTYLWDFSQRFGLSKRSFRNHLKCKFWNNPRISFNRKFLSTWVLIVKNFGILIRLTGNRFLLPAHFRNGINQNFAKNEKLIFWNFNSVDLFYKICCRCKIIEWEFSIQ